MDFPEIAMQKLSQTAPELVNLIVAFRDISEEASAENDVTVGAFILKSGASNYYIPVIKKDHTTHPIDSVFFCDEGKFRPLSKSTVSKIMNASKLDPGKKTKIPNGVSRNPSVYDLVNPPRTGKFVYASDSRVSEFLASTPNHIKAFVRTRVSEDSGLANGLNKLYGIEDFISALKDTPVEHKAIVEAPAKAVLTFGDNLDDRQAKEVLAKGYSVNESYPHANRVAIPQEEFEYHGQLHQITPSTDQGKCFRLLTADGGIVEAYVMKEVMSVPTKMETPYGTHGQGYSLPCSRKGVVATASGRLMALGKFIAVGDELVGERDNSAIVGSILSKFTHRRNLIGARDVHQGGHFAILTPEMGILVSGQVEAANWGRHTVTLRLRTEDGTVNVAFISSLKNIVTDASGTICIPEGYPLVEMDEGFDSYEAAHKIECMNINYAQTLLSSQALTALGDRISIGHDGIDYSLNGSVVGPAHKAIEVLIMNEGIDPVRAESFIKRASETKKCVVLMSKKADFSPGEIPEFGDKPQPQAEAQMNGANIQQALDSGDKQIADAMIISELLQSPDLFGVIAEYLPDINEAVDRLGRVLFMSRVRMDQLIQASGSESAMSTIASVKAVYRNLGDNLVKLEQLISNVKAT